MKAFAQPLSKLQVEATRFMRSHELRLMHVVTDRDLHDAVVQLLLAQELRLDNRSPFVIFEQSHGKANPGWDLRTHAAREQHERRRAEMAANGETLGELPNAPTSTGLTSFAEQLGQLLVVRPEQTEGLVVLLAPAYVDDQERWQTAIATLLSLEGLAAVRWIIVDLGKSTIPKVVSKHERRMLSLRCVADGESPKAVLAEVMNEDLLQWSGPIGARPKGVVPPCRVDSPPPASLDPKAPLQLAINRNVLHASVAMDEGRLSDAVRHQREARDLAARAEMIDQSVTMDLLLGAYLLAAGAPDKAEETYRRAALTAKRAELPDKVATAHIAIGSTKLTRNDRPGALVAYADASLAAEQAGNPMLALEACRLTGDIANELHMDAQAIAFWSKAVKLGEQDPATAPLTGAGLAALNLALLCQQRQQPRQAEIFLAKAHQLTGVDPDLLNEEARKQARERAQQLLKLEHPVKARPAEHQIPKEGSTQRLTMSDLQALHWGAAPATPTAPTHPQSTKTQRLQMVHHWSQDEQEKLRDATNKIADEATTDLLSPAELRALRGETDMPDAQATPGIERTLRVDPKFLPSLRERHGTPSPNTEPIRTGRTQRVEVTDLGALREQQAAEMLAGEATRQHPPSHPADPDVPQRRPRPRAKLGTEHTVVLSPNDLPKLRRPASNSDGLGEGLIEPPVHAQKTERVSMSDLQALRKLADAKNKDEG